MAETKTYYSCSPYEELHHTTVDAAVEDWLDGLTDYPLPEALTVFRYVTKRVDEGDVKNASYLALEHLLSYLEEDYGNPEEGMSPTAEMESIMLEATRKVVERLDVWSCEEEKPPVRVQVAPWIRAHCPTWLEDEETLAEVERLEAGDKSHGGQDG